MLSSITLQQIHFSLSHGQKIFENLNLTLNSNEKAALIGANGIGKSTLFQLITGELQPESGSIKRQAGFGYLPQKIMCLTGTIADVLGINQKLDAIRKIEQGSVEQKYFDIIGQDWDILEKAEKELSLIGLDYLSLERNVTTLSGGELIQLLLAGLFLADVDILLLDEPTNNLYYKARYSFYERLRQWKKGALVISHNRELLDQMNLIHELSAKGIQSYGGNYSFYQQQKQTEADALEQKIITTEKELNNITKTQLALQQKGSKKVKEGKKKDINRKWPLKHGQKSKGQQTAAKLIKVNKNRELKIQQQISKLKNEQDKSTTIKMTVLASAKKPKIAIKISSLDFGYPDQPPIFQDFNLTIQRGDRIGIIGDNGSGKSTLVKIILKNLTVQKGHVDVHGRVIYLDQKLNLLEDNLNLIDNFFKLNPNSNRFNAYRELAHFKFYKDEVQKYPKELSCGELIKAILACMIANEMTSDIIILDEPTNNMDIDSMEILEQALKTFNGTLIVVSHDQRFLNEIAVDQYIELA